MIEITAKTPHLQQVKMYKEIEEKLLKTNFPPRSNCFIGRKRKKRKRKRRKRRTRKRRKSSHLGQKERSLSGKKNQNQRR